MRDIKLLVNLSNPVLKVCISVNRYLTLDNRTEMKYKHALHDPFGMCGACTMNSGNKPKNNGQLYENITGFTDILATAKKAGVVLFSGEKNL
jgi:hypothetical protein